MSLILDRLPESPLITIPMAEDVIRLVAAPLPIPVAKINRLVPRGQTLAELLAVVPIPAGMVPVIEVDSHAIDRRYWAHVRPKAGRTVTIRGVPMGGGQGGDSNKGLRTALLAVVIIAAIAVTVLTYGAGAAGAFGLSAVAWGAIGAVGSAAVMVGGGLLVNALVPVQQPRSSSLAAADNVWGITGTRNVMPALGMPIPRCYGRHRQFPMYGAEPYTEILGGEQYIRAAFCLGYGPVAITDIKIGDTPIEHFQGIEIEGRHGFPTDTPLTIFANDVAEDAESVRLVYAVDTIRVARQEADVLSIDLFFPEGIYAQNSRGGLEVVYTSVFVAYRLAGTSDPWQIPPGLPSPHPQFLEYTVTVDGQVVFQPQGQDPTPGLIEFREASKTPIRRGHIWSVPVRGTYEIRVTKQQMDREGGGEAGADQCWWSALRAIKVVDPIPRTDVAKIAVRIRATEQLNGVLDTFNCVTHSLLPDWTGAEWALQVTSNPASIYRDILQGSATAKPVPDARVELPDLIAWHGECAAAGFEYNAMIDGRTTVFEMLREVAAVGRGAFGMGSFGKFSVVRDRPQTVPVAHVTPRTSWDYSGRRLFPDAPHALKMRWIDPASNWQQVESVIYDDGYSEATATLIETAEYRGVTNFLQVFKIARYLIAVARLRPEVHECQQDFEHLIYTRGDLVRLSHDVISAGLQVGRITAVAVDGGDNATSITADETFTIPDVPGSTGYGVKIRNVHGIEIAAQVQAVPGASTTLYFVTPIPQATRPAGGELVMFGELGQETIDVLAHSIAPGKDLTARVTFVPAAPAVHLADQGPIPAWNPQIQKPVLLATRLPAKPIIDSVRSDEDALVLSLLDGTLTTRILLSIRYAATIGAPSIAMLQVQFKRSDSTIWQSLQSPVSGPATQVGVAPVDDGVAYDVRLRSVSGLPTPGLVSEWAEVRQHFVVGKTTPPPDVPALTLEGAYLRWPYPAAPRDLAGFLIRRHFGERATWDDAQPFAMIAAFADAVVYTYPVALERTSVTTYVIRAIDRAGLVSAGVAWVVVNLGEPLTGPILRTVDYRAAGWPGTYDGVVLQGDLIAQSTTLFWGPVVSLFWSTVAGADQYGVQSMLYFWVGGQGEAVSSGTSSTPFWNDRHGPLQYRFSILPTSIEVGADLLLNATVTATAWALEYQLTGSELFWKGDTIVFWPTDDATLFWGDAPAGDTWLPSDGRLRNITRQVYEFRILAQGTVLQSKISALTIKIDAPLVEESFNDILLPAIGGRLPITKRYRAITTVTHGIEASPSGSTVVGVETIDKGVGTPYLTEGPLLQGFNAARAPTVALVDAVVRGY